MKPKTFIPSNGTVSRLSDQTISVNEAALAVQNWNSIRYDEQITLNHLNGIPGFIIDKSLYPFFKNSLQNESAEAEVLLNMYLGIENGTLSLFSILQDRDAQLFQNPDLPNVLIHRIAALSNQQLIEMGFLTDFPFIPGSFEPIGLAEAWRRLALWNIAKVPFIEAEIAKASEPSSEPLDEKGVVRVFEAKVTEIVAEFESMGPNPNSLLALFGLKQDEKSNTVMDLSFWAIPDENSTIQSGPKTTVTDFTTPKPPFGISQSTGQKLYPSRFGLSQIRPQ